MKTWLSVEEAALVTNRTKWTIYKWISRGKIKPHMGDDGTIRINSKTLLKVEAATRPGRRPNTPSHNRSRCA